MYLSTIDCGTTNSRVYIVNEQGHILGKAAKKVGVKDTAIHGNNQVLKEGLRETFYHALKESGVSLKDVMFVVSSGMITSEIGLLEIPHIWAPTGMDDLAMHIKPVHDTNVFPVDITIHFIPGIKNRYDPSTARIMDVGCLDFMRGEEAQVAGILSSQEIDIPVTIVILSSHTKFIPVDEKKRVLGSLTTLSGQVYEAIIKETFIGKSVRADDAFDEERYFEGDVVEAAHRWVTESGFLRSLLMPRFLDVLLQTKWYERKLFVEAAIAAEDMRVLHQFESLGFPVKTNYILVGPERRCAIYQYMLKRKMGITEDILTITDADDIDSLSILGAIDLAGKAGLIKR